MISCTSNTLARRHKIKDFFLICQPAQSWFLIYQCFMCKPKKNLICLCLSFTCAELLSVRKAKFPEGTQTLW